MSGQRGMFAVAVRDRDLYLFLRIRRNSKGEVFVMFPRKDRGWDPHASYHADGSLHSKSHDRKSFVRQCAKPGASFLETVTFPATHIGKNDAKTNNIICRPDEFEDIFEIPLSDFDGTKYANISVDLTPPDGRPNVCGRIIRHKVLFRDATPWIVVTLSDTTSRVGV